MRNCSKLPFRSCIKQAGCASRPPTDVSIALDVREVVKGSFELRLDVPAYHTQPLQPHLVCRCRLAVTLIVVVESDMDNLEFDCQRYAKPKYDQEKMAMLEQQDCLVD